MLWKLRSGVVGRRGPEDLRFLLLMADTETLVQDCGELFDLCTGISRTGLVEVSSPFIL